MTSTEKPHVPHDFKYPQLAYDAEPNSQPYIKLSFFFSKLPEVSYEYFHKHWASVHADLTLGVKSFKDCKIQRYVQYHQTPDLKEKAESLGIPLLDFDGCSTIYVKEWDDWMRFYNSEDYKKALNPDVGHFMAMPIRVMVGYDVLQYGSAILEGRDGVTSEKLISE